MSERLSVLFLGKLDDHFGNLAGQFIAHNFSDAAIVLGRRGQPLPPEATQWRGDYVISYLSPWIVPAELLERAAKAAINFHTGPPEYPGIGCTNVALYNGETVYGVTCHHMLPRVDTGAIIAVRRFPVLPQDTVWHLTQRCYAYILALFYEVMIGLLQGQPLPASPERWTRRPYLRRELDELCRVTPDMSEEEIRRRVRATTYPKMPGAHLELAGFRFELRNGEDGGPEPKKS